MKKQTFELAGLQGVRRKKTKAIFINSHKNVNRPVLMNKIAFTSAGDKGAINIWQDDTGFIRCHAMRYLSSLEQKTFTKISDVKTWTKEWLIKIN